MVEKSVWERLVFSQTFDTIDLVKNGTVKMTRYDPLKEYLSASGRIMITLTFDEINAIIAPAQLPATAYQKTQWWENGLTTPGRHCSSWLGAGYRTVDITRNR